MGHSNHNSTSSLSDVSSFVTRDGVTFDARRNQGFPNIYKVKITAPTSLSTGYTHKPSPRHLSANSSDTLNHLEYVPPRHAFSNTSKINTLYNANNRTWQGIHDSLTMAKNGELFETDFIVQDEQPHVDSTRVNIQINKHCMTELLLLDNTKVLCLFDTGSNVNLISYVIKSSEYLTSIPILDCPDYTIRNTTGEINANKFIELCFRVKDNFILTTTALVVPDFDSVKFLLSISSMNHLNSVIDVSAIQISIRKKIICFQNQLSQ